MVLAEDELEERLKRLVQDPKKKKWYKALAHEFGVEIAVAVVSSIGVLMYSYGNAQNSRLQYYEVSATVVENLSAKAQQGETEFLDTSLDYRTLQDLLTQGSELEHEAEAQALLQDLESNRYRFRRGARKDETSEYLREFGNEVYELGPTTSNKILKNVGGQLFVLPLMFEFGWFLFHSRKMVDKRAKKKKKKKLKGRIDEELPQLLKNLADHPFKSKVYELILEVPHGTVERGNYLLDALHSLNRHRDLRYRPILAGIMENIHRHLDLNPNGIDVALESNGRKLNLPPYSD